jgi:hypothetical protein
MRDRQFGYAPYWKGDAEASGQELSLHVPALVHPAWMILSPISNAVIREPNPPLTSAAVCASSSFVTSAAFTGLLFSISIIFPFQLFVFRVVFLQPFAVLLCFQFPS